MDPAELLEFRSYAQQLLGDVSLKLDAWAPARPAYEAEKPRAIDAAGAPPARLCVKARVERAAMTATCSAEGKPRGGDRAGRRPSHMVPGESLSSERRCSMGQSGPTRSNRSSIGVLSSIVPRTESGVVQGVMCAVSAAGHSATESLRHARRWGGKEVGEWISASMIMLNAISIGLHAEVNGDGLGWLIVDSGFAAFFLLEMLAKIWFFGVREYFFGVRRRCAVSSDADLRWRWFEFLLVLHAILEIVTLALPGMGTSLGGVEFGILRILRLTRVGRLLRVCRLQVFTELVMMIHGAIGGLRTLLWGIILISFPLYAVSLLMHESVGSRAHERHGAENFRTLSMSWFTMFRCSVAGDCATSDGRPIFLLLVEHYGWGYGLVFCTSAVVMLFGLFNVIAAIFVENTLAAAKSNTALHKRKRLLDTQRFAQKAAELVQFVWRIHQRKEEDPGFDVVGRTVSQRFLSEHSDAMSEEDIDRAASLQITPEFFTFLLSFREMRDLLEDLDVANEDHIDLFDTLDVDGGGTLDLEEMIVGIAKLRGDARRSDIVGVGLVVRSIQSDIRRLEEFVFSSLPANSMCRCSPAASLTLAAPDGNDEVSSNDFETRAF